jgi:hypothetical protein
MLSVIKGLLQNRRDRQAMLNMRAMLVQIDGLLFFGAS